MREIASILPAVNGQAQRCGIDLVTARCPGPASRGQRDGPAGREQGLSLFHAASAKTGSSSVERNALRRTPPATCETSGARPRLDIGRYHYHRPRVGCRAAAVTEEVVDGMMPSRTATRPSQSVGRSWTKTLRRPKAS